MSKSFKVKQAAWFKDIEQEFFIPDSFELDIIGPNDAPPMSEEAIANAIRKPLGPSMTAMAQGMKRIVFVVDDLGRPTPAHDIIPNLLDLLFQTGIEKKNISFVIATGSHRQLSQTDLELKLGQEIVASYPVTSHDAFNSPMIHLGVLDNGFPCIANKEVAEADLIVGIGCVIPHSCHGFGGGAKLFCPGIAGMESIVTMHGFTPKRGRVVGDVPEKEWDMRSASEAFVLRLPPIFLVNVVVNSKREICALFAGRSDEVFRAARNIAQQVYRTVIDRAKAKQYDVVFVNMYPLDSDPVQSGKSPWIKKFFKNAIPIQINSSADGIDYHGWKLLRRSRLSTLIILLIGEGLSLKFMPSFFRRPASWSLIKKMRAYCVKRMLENPGVDYPTFFKNLKTKEVLVDELNMAEQQIPSLQKSPWIYSENYPPPQFRKKYPRGTLLRSWDSVIMAISHYFPNAKVAVVTCAPVQIPVLKGDHEGPH
ncbi:DUF2088 domain-containing protein [bacterium]|nr:MAG: DUF2088 domain-containing protein [bacterium]